MREIECAVMGNDEPEASLPGEYVVHDERAKFLDYTEKYSSTGHVDFVVPAPLGARLAKRVQRMAVKAFKAVDGAGFARVDFFLRRDTNKLLINELNTIPGLTEVSGFPQDVGRVGRAVLERHRPPRRTRHRKTRRQDAQRDEPVKVAGAGGRGSGAQCKTTFLSFTGP